MNDGYKMDPRIEWIFDWKFQQYYGEGRACPPQAVEEAIRDIEDAILDGRIVIEEVEK